MHLVKFSAGNNTMVQELVRQRELLRMEYEYERKQFQQQTEAVGVERKVKRGLCWFPLQVGHSYYNSLDQLVVEVTNCTPQEDIEHQFEPGKPVCFFEQDASEMLRYMRFVGQINYVEGNRMIVVMPNAESVTQVQNAQRLGIQLYLDEYTYRQMFAALDQVINAKSGRLAELSTHPNPHPNIPSHQYASPGSIPAKSKPSTRFYGLRTWP